MVALTAGAAILLGDEESDTWRSRWRLGAWTCTKSSETRVMPGGG